MQTRSRSTLPKEASKLFNFPLIGEIERAIRKSRRNGKTLIESSITTISTPNQRSSTVIEASTKAAPMPEPEQQVHLYRRIIVQEQPIPSPMSASIPESEPESNDHLNPISNVQKNRLILKRALCFSKRVLCVALNWLMILLLAIGIFGGLESSYQLLMVHFNNDDEEFNSRYQVIVFDKYNQTYKIVKK